MLIAYVLMSKTIKRFFASLRMTLQELCHPERSEESQNSVILPLLYKNLFTIYDVETGLCNLGEFATLEVVFLL